MRVGRFAFFELIGWTLAFILGFPFIVSLGAGASLSAELRVNVENLRNGDGLARLALFDRSEQFPYGEAVARVNVPAAGEFVSVLFSDLAPGTYAIAMFHDEDGDDEFAENFLGFPSEGYGFSNDVRAFFGPPSFASAAITLRDGEARLNTTIHVVY